MTHETPDYAAGILVCMSTGVRQPAGNSSALRYSAVHCNALHYSAVHCSAVHCTTLHCTALHSTVLQLSSNGTSNSLHKVTSMCDICLTIVCINTTHGSHLKIPYNARQ